MKIGDEVAQLFDRRALKEALAFDHNKDVEFVGREAPCHLLKRLEFGRIGSKELTKGIIDLDTRYPKRRRYQQHHGGKPNEQRKAQGDQTDALETESIRLVREACGEIRPVAWFGLA